MSDDEPTLDAVERLLAAARAGEDVTARLAELPPAQRDAVATAIAAEQALLGPVRPSAAATPQRFGHFLLRRQLGRGGQGTIWLADDQKLRRTVALKILAAGTFSAERLARFRREAEITARLDHPGICVVHETGELDGRAYIAMRHVAGASLAALLAPPAAPRATAPDGAPPLPAAWEARCLLVERAARALHAAHEAGVIHRDVKPANLMVTPAGDVVLLDFGLASDLSPEAETLTDTNASLGTPAYSSPEQIRGESHAVDRRTDVWSLGVVLFELVTGRRPFAAPTRDALYRAILSDPAPDPRQLSPRLPADLAVVLATALGKRPEDRYATALAFAEDLERVRTLRPIRARPAPLRTRVARFVQREPRLAAALLAFVVALAAGLVVALSALARANTALRRAEAMRELAEARVRIGRDPARALATALGAADDAPRELVNDVLLEILERVLVERELDGGGGAIVDACISGDGTRLATSAEDGGARVFARASGALIRSFGAATRGRPIALDAGGTALFVGGSDGRVLRLDVASGRPTGTLVVGTKPITSLAARPGAPELAVGDGGGHVALISADGADGAARELAAHDEHAGPVRRVVFGHGGTELVSAGADGQILRFDLATRALRGRRTLPGPIDDVAASADGRFIVSTSGDTSVCLWADDPAEPLLLWRHAAASSCVAFAPAGAVFASGGIDRALCLWHADRLDSYESDASARAPLRRLVFAPDGAWVLAAGDDGRARVIRARRCGARLRLRHGSLETRVARFALGGTALVTLGDDGTVRVTATADGATLASIGDWKEPVTSVAVAADGRHLALATTDRAWITELPAAAARIDLALPSGAPTTNLGVRFDPAGTRILVVAQDGKATLDAADDGRVLGEFAFAPPTAAGREVAAAFTADGTRLFAPASREGGGIGVAQWRLDGAAPAGGPPLWRSDAGAKRGEVGADGDAELLAVAGDAPDCQLAWSASDGRVRLARFTARGTGDGDVRASECELVARGATRATALAFDPRGTRLLIASADGRARLCDTSPGADGRELATVAAHVDAIRAVAFAPDGRLLATAGDDGAAHLWSTVDLARIATQSAHGRPVLQIAFSPDGTTLVSAGLDAEVRLWPADPLAFARSLNGE